MKLAIVGLWAVAVTLGAGWAATNYALSGTASQSASPTLAGLQYTSLPTISVPVIKDGGVGGYVVVRMVYTADSAVLKNLASKPDSFITDAMFRLLYADADTDFGKLKRIDLGKIAEAAKDDVNARMGDAVVQSLLIDGLNYIDLTAADGGRADKLAVGEAIAQAAATAKAAPAAGVPAH